MSWIFSYVLLNYCYHINAGRLLVYIIYPRVLTLIGLGGEGADKRYELENLVSFRINLIYTFWQSFDTSPIVKMKLLAIS